MSWALLFPGQGSQRPGMISTITQDPAATRVLDGARSVIGDENLDWLDTSGGLATTSGAQLSLFIAEVASAASLTSSLIPNYVAGHSVGTLAAAATCGAISFAEGIDLVRVRARTMEQLHPSGYGMAAVLRRTERDVRHMVAAIDKADDPVFVAIVNADNQIVVAGSEAGLDRLAEVAGGGVARLDIKTPSHCPLLAAVTDTLHTQLAAIPTRRLRCSYVLNSRPRTTIDARAVLDDLALSPSVELRWLDMLILLSELGVELFVEAQPGDILTRIVHQVLPHTRAVAIKDVTPLELEMLIERAAHDTSPRHQSLRPPTEEY